MAKLSARGRTELIRFRKESDVNDPDRIVDKRRVTRAFMSDGKVLEKHAAHFLPTRDNDKPYWHDWGWKIRGTLKAGNAVEDIRRIYTERGWIETKR